VPGSPLTFTAATPSCGNCTGPFTFSWDFSSLDGGIAKVDSTVNPVTVTAPPPTVNRVTLTVTDSAGHVVTATRRLPLTITATGTSALTQGTAGGSWTDKWLGGVVTSTSVYAVL